jgi:hypothetical protein
MYVIAVIGDLCSLVPLLNMVTTPITAIALGIAGAGTKHSIYSDKRIGGTLAVILVETLPIISFVPAWTLRVYMAKQDS